MTTELGAAQVVDPDQLTRAQKALLTLTGDVARQLAEDHGVCVRPLAMRRIDLTTGRVDVVPVPCGSRREDLCPPCAVKQRRHRVAAPWSALLAGLKSETGRPGSATLASASRAALPDVEAEQGRL